MNAILLVGGFGSSEYLHQRLSNHSYGNRKIDVVQPVNALVPSNVPSFHRVLTAGRRTAIARGALLRGIDGSIIMTRRAERHYGSDFGFYYDPQDTVPPGGADHLYFDPFLEELMLPGKMNWYVKKGAKIEPSRSSFQWISQVTPGHQPTFVFSSTLYDCELEEAPEYLWQKPTGTPSAPIFSPPNGNSGQTSLHVSRKPLFHPSS